VQGEQREDGPGAIRLGELTLLGDPARGVLSGVRNRAAGAAIAFDAPGPVWRLTAERDGRTTTLDPRACDLQALSEREGAFRHADTGITVRLAWEAEAPDAAACVLSFDVADPAVTVTRLTFLTPDAVRLDGTGPDVLVYPYAGGVRIERPAEELFVRPDVRTAAWRDRFLSVRERGFDLEECDGAVDFGYSYSGRCSMMWLDYFAGRGGVYLACHDPDFEHAFLGVTARRGEAGLRLRIEKRFNRRLAAWSGRFVLGLHEGDWHHGARLYRAFFDRCGRAIRRPPARVARGPGLLCHYDFKWQDGAITHRFEEIPRLAEEARALGFCDLLIAGWNTGGFDNLYPDFRPAPELGGEAALAAGLRAAQAQGSRVYLYTNAFSYDDRHPEYARRGLRWAVKDRHGAPFGVQWGSRLLAGMCNSVADWRATVKANVRYIVETVGADGAYIDQLAVSPRECHDPAHTHARGWIAELGPELNARVFLFSEWLTDALATRLDAQLMHTCWAAGLRYAFPEMFRYTFPEAMVIDQVLQKPWPGDPQDVEGSRVEEVFCREFITGIQFWTYDHVPCAQRFGALFRKAIALRQAFAETFAEARFVDDTLGCDAPEGVVLKAFTTSHDALLAVWNRTGKTGTLGLHQPVTCELIARDLDGAGGRSRLRACETIPLPDSVLSLHLLKGCYDGFPPAG